MCGDPFIGFNVAGEFLFNAGPQDFDRNRPALGRDGFVDLCNGGCAHRMRIDGLKQCLQRHAKRLLNGRAHLFKGKGRQSVLQTQEIAGRLFADEVGTGRERLTKLDGCRTNFLKCPGIIRLFRQKCAQSGEARNAAQACRGGRATLNAQQCAIARQNAAPFQQPPEMEDAGGQIFQPL